MTAQEIKQEKTAKVDHLHQLKEHVMKHWPESRNEVPLEIKSYLLPCNHIECCVIAFNAP